LIDARHWSTNRGVGPIPRRMDIGWHAVFYRAGTRGILCRATMIMSPFALVRNVP
jgi:hypothetical protein